MSFPSNALAVCSANAKSAFPAGLSMGMNPAFFTTGTPNVPALYAATAGYDVIEEVSVSRIRMRSIEQTALLVELIDGAGFELTSPRDPAQRGGSVVFSTPHFEAVHRELAERAIICDFRPDAGLRFGPHFFNTDDELRFAVGQVTEIVETGAYERHLGASARY